MASTALFDANSSTLGWEGSVAGIPFQDHLRVPYSERVQIRIVVRADPAFPENNYLLTLDSRLDGKSTHITVARGAHFPYVSPSVTYFDFLEDMSDGKQHDFDLRKSSVNVVGTLNLRMTR